MKQLSFPFSLTVALPLLSVLLLCSGKPAATLHNVERYAGEKTNKLIVTLNEGVKRESVVSRLKGVYAEWDSVFNGFSGVFDEATITALRSSSDVKAVEEDGIFHVTALVTQRDAPWGLCRLSATGKIENKGLAAVNYPYTYEEPAGSGVDIYLLDTGVRTTHNQFGGRARWGVTYGGYPSGDGNGHGTHMAGLACGTQFGVAKASNLISVRVMNDAGNGSVTDIISGLNWVLNQHRGSGRPSVVAFPISGSAHTGLDNAVTSLTNNGIHVVVAAGNGNVDIRNISPARVPSVISVGATNIEDARASTSNYGANITLFAPGQNSISASNANNTATNVLSGTSIGAAHVAGLVAYFIKLVGNMSPTAMIAKVKEDSVIGYLSNIPQGTPNRLITNSYVCTSSRICI